MFMEVRRAWRSGISAALSSGWAPAPQLLPAPPSSCPKAQDPFVLLPLVRGSCPSDTLCCRIGRSPPLSPRCAQEGSDTPGQSASPTGADPASTPCSGCWEDAIWRKQIKQLSVWISFKKKTLKQKKTKILEMKNPPVVTHPRVATQVQIIEKVEIFENSMLDEVQTVVGQIQLMEVQKPGQGAFKKSWEAKQHPLVFCA